METVIFIILWLGSSKQIWCLDSNGKSEKNKKYYYAKLSRDANPQISCSVGRSAAIATLRAKVLSLRSGQLALTCYGSNQRGMRFKEYFETRSRHFQSAYKHKDNVLNILYQVR